MILLSWTTLTLLAFFFLLHSFAVSSFTVGVGSSSRRRRHRGVPAIVATTSTTAKTTFFRPFTIICATVADDEIQQQQQQQQQSSSSSDISDEVYDDSPWKHKVLHKMSLLRQEAMDYAAARYDDFQQSGYYEATVYALFSALRLEHVPLGLKGQPILWRREEIEKAMQMQPDTTDTNTDADTDSSWSNFFTMGDLEKAVTDDFLDAARGSTDNRKGWKVAYRI
jgi:hypothetical protein